MTIELSETDTNLSFFNHGKVAKFFRAILSRESPILSPAVAIKAISEEVGETRLDLSWSLLSRMCFDHNLLNDDED